MSTSIPPPGYEPLRTYGPIATPDAAPAATPDTAPAVSLPARRRTGRSKLLAGGLVLAAAVGMVFMLLGSTNSQATDPIAQAATLSSSAPGYRMNVNVAMSLPGLSAPVTASGTAVVDLRDDALSMTVGIDLSQIPGAAQALGSSTMEMRGVLENGVMYMRFPAAVAEHVPGFGGKQWIRIELAKVVGMPGLSSLGDDPAMSDPSRMLEYLRAASSSLTDEGQQQVDGVLTTHYRAELSLNRIANSVPVADRAAVQRALSSLAQATHVQSLPFDVWIDAHHLVRRVVISLSVPSATGTIQETVTGDVSDYGPQPRPTPPPADQVANLASLANLGG